MKPHDCLKISCVLAALCCASVDAVAQTWTQLNPSTQPGPRRSGAAAFVIRNTGAIFYGGLLQPTAITNETWRFDGKAWSKLSPNPAPPARWGHRMVYDTRRGKVVTFGGRSPTIRATANDTWEYDGSRWTKATPTASPRPRAFYSMAYDERRGVTVMFGAMSPFVGGEHWEYDGKTWKEFKGKRPSSRETPAMCYDKGRGVVLMFGGWSSPSMKNDTWEFDGTAWTQVTTKTKPIARFRAAMIYDESRGRCVLYGGFGNASALQDTWEFDGNDWRRVATTGPASSTESYMVYDRLRQQTYHFGGSSRAGVGGATWSYRGPKTPIFAAFGKGCAGGNGTPTLQAVTKPSIGKTFTQRVVGLPTSAKATVLLSGFSAIAWGALRLPIVAPIGLTGCQLEIAADLAFVLPAASGVATAPIPIPNDTKLLGVPFYSQALTLDAAAGNKIGTLSRAGHAVLGR